MTITQKHHPPSDYYQHVRLEIVEHILKGDHTILDVGCGAGALGDYLRKEGHAKIVNGLELIPEIAAKASERLNKVICTNLNNNDLVRHLNELSVYYDYIICADVLEHCVDPWSVLADLVQYLKPQGKLIISIPNIRHWSVSLSLVFKGEWCYQEEGLLDRTHLRFFTRKSLDLLITDSGLKMLRCSGNVWGRYMKLLDYITFGLFDGVLTGHYIVVCSKQNLLSNLKHKQIII